MYDFLIGPMLWISIGICLVGLGFRFFLLFKISKGKTKSNPLKINFSIDKNSPSTDYKRFKGYAFRKQTAFAAISLLFHLLVITLPLVAIGHSTLFFMGFGINLPSLPDTIVDFLTGLCVILGVILLIRRTFFKQERALSTPVDYALIILVIAPFATGLASYHQLIDYQIAIMTHIIMGELLLIAIGTTKLSHMVFFIFSKLFISNELNTSWGSRRW